MKHPMGFRADREELTKPVAPREIWEHDILDTYNYIREDKTWGDQYDQKVRELMAEMSSQGWRLVNATPSGYKDHERLYFTRPKQ